MITKYKIMTDIITISLVYLKQLKIYNFTIRVNNMLNLWYANRKLKSLGNVKLTNNDDIKRCKKRSYI